MANGQNIAGLLGDTTIATTDQLFIVLSDYCPACRLAKARLEANHVTYVALKPCGVFGTTTPCFSYRGDYMTPLFLRTDADGLIVFAHEGWPDDPRAQGVLISNLLTSARKGTTTNPRGNQ